MKDERAGDVDPLRAVMDLVETTPEKADVVRRAVPRVDDAFQDEDADERAADDAEARAVEEADAARARPRE